MSQVIYRRAGRNYLLDWDKDLAPGFQYPEHYGLHPLDEIIAVLSGRDIYLCNSLEITPCLPSQTTTEASSSSSPSSATPAAEKLEHS